MRLLSCLKFLWRSRMPGWWMARPQDVHPLILLFTHRALLAHRAYVRLFLSSAYPCFHPHSASTHLSIHPSITLSHRRIHIHINIY